VIDRTPLARILRWALFAAYLGMTYRLSSQPSVPSLRSIPDVVLHTVEFSVLAMLLLLALGGTLRGPNSRRVLAIVWGFGAVYAVVDEFHQSFVPGRDASVKDALVDIAATSLVVLAVVISGRRQGRSAAAGEGSSPLPPGPGRAAAGTRGGPAHGIGAAPDVLMLTKPGCSLCDRAGEILTEVLGPEGIGWRSQDISRDTVLDDRHGNDIPVVFVAGVRRFKGVVEKERLVRLLADGARLRSRASSTRS
jgi:VanZ family protein